MQRHRSGGLQAPKDYILQDTKGNRANERFRGSSTITRESSNAHGAQNFEQPQRFPIRRQRAEMNPVVSERYG